MRTATKPLLLSCLLLAVLYAATYLLGAEPQKATDQATTQPASFAIVELFTSEGCSSCPAADVLLTDLTKDAESKGQPVFSMEFHVDYWNRLGWADPFSDAEFSRRQTDYAHHLRLSDIYTPQMVINGVTEFVGSDRKAATRAIDKALASAQLARVSIHPTTSPDGKRYDVSFTVNGAPSDAVLNVALVERGLSTEVRRGENGGHTLKHGNVVRWFKTNSLPPNGRGAVQVPRLQGADESRMSFIAYVQSPGPGAVLGAVSQAVADGK